MNLQSNCRTSHYVNKDFGKLDVYWHESGHRGYSCVILIRCINVGLTLVSMGSASF